MCVTVIPLPLTSPYLQYFHRRTVHRPRDEYGLQEKQPLAGGRFPKSSRASSREGATYRSIGDDSPTTSPPLAGSRGVSASGSNNVFRGSTQPTLATVAGDDEYLQVGDSKDAAPAGGDDYLQIGGDAARQESGDSNYLKVGDDDDDNNSLDESEATDGNEYLQIGDDAGRASLPSADLLGLPSPTPQGVCVCVCVCVCVS